MKIKFLKAILVGIMLSASCFVNIVNAEIIAIDSVRGVGNRADIGVILGVKFDVLSAITITELGAFDSNQDGFTTEIEVGIFDFNTNLLVTEIALFNGTNNPLIGQSRFFDIVDVNLNVGSYIIAARGFNLDNQNGNAYWEATNILPTVNDGNGLIKIDIGSNYYVGGNELVAPHTSDAEPENIYDAGTFIYSAVVEPEPSTLVIFVLGIMGLGIFRIKNRK